MLIGLHSYNFLALTNIIFGAFLQKKKKKKKSPKQNNQNYLAQITTK